MSTVNQGNSGLNVNQKSPHHFENGLNVPISNSTGAPLYSTGAPIRKNPDTDIFETFDFNSNEWVPLSTSSNQLPAKLAFQL